LTPSRRAAVGLVLALACRCAARAETGADAWLRYAPADHLQMAPARPRVLIAPGRSPIALSASRELGLGLHSIFGVDLTPVGKTGGADAILLGTLTQVHALRPGWTAPSVGAQGFVLSVYRHAGHTDWIVAGADERGELYGVFRVLERLASQQSFAGDVETPSAPIRWVNQWDNLDGSIERGYAGRSIFFDHGHVRQDLSRVDAYGRLLASIGLNGCTVNNVNANLHTLETPMLRELARIADAFRPWGVRMSLSVDLSSPQVVGGLKTFDPVDPGVAQWWQSKVDEIYRLIPDFAGFVVKADSEGRAGPSQYGRTPAEAANVLARALASHHGLVLYRGFVYNHHLDFNDLKADRARAGYDNFRALDGRFEPNVVIQIKHGPIDFQAREPVSPLFAALHHTSEAIELQTTQEYTGQQRHMVFLVPMWKTALDTDMRADGRSTPVKEIVEGKSFHQPLGGFVSVVNVGLEANWLHHPMAMANLYGFGRLAWNPNLSSEEIAATWTRLTFGNNATVVSAVSRMQLDSWQAYEQYTGPLGMGTLTNILGYHFGPGIDTADHNGWGQWIRADHQGVGMDRTVATGTGYIGQYPPELAAVYESLKTCPDNLLLFMHHVPYTYSLHSGKTVIQHIYDAHYAGAQTAAGFVDSWQRLQGLVDEERFGQVLKLLNFQAGHAVVWRDAIDVWFMRESGIADALGRVGHDANRVEAEAMRLSGYVTVPVQPFETASGGQAVTCPVAGGCELSVTLQRPAGEYRLRVGYYDLRGGVSRYTALLNGKQIAAWTADDTLPPAQDDMHLDGQTATRFDGPVITIKPGDRLTLHGIPGAQEPAPVDYVELVPAEHANR
jgi:alpha-glucuronidase